MLFGKYSVALIQFREPGKVRAPYGVVDLGVESEPDEAARRAENGRKAPMQTLLERNGASFAWTSERLYEAGFALTEARAQRRHTMGTEHRRPRIYTLITFVFKKGGASDATLQEPLRLLSRKRYEHAKVAEGVDGTGRPMLSFGGKTTADRAVELHHVDDCAAKAYGMTVTRATRKRHRGDGATGSTPPLATKEEAAPTSETDSQLKRLMEAGWRVDPDKAPQQGAVHLFRISVAGTRGEFTLYLARTRSQDAGPLQRKRA